MKKLIVVSSVLMLFAGTSRAQTEEASAKQDIANLQKNESMIRKEKKEEEKELRKLEGKEVNYQSREQFYSDFGNVPVRQWVRTANFNEVTFVKDCQEMVAYYDADAKLVGTTTIKSFDDLPANAQKSINRQYPGYSKEQVILFDDNELSETDMTLFNMQFDDADNYFIELKKDARSIILKVDMRGDVSLFKELR